MRQYLDLLQHILDHGTEKSDTLTLLFRVFKGYVFMRETSMVAMEDEAILRGMGKELLLNQFT